MDQHSDRGAADSSENVDDPTLDTSLVPADVREPEPESPAAGSSEPVDHEEDRSIPAGDVAGSVVDDVVAYFDGEEDAPLPAPDRVAIESEFFDFSYLESYTEIEHYWVHRPYSFVSVLYDDTEREYRYHVTEADLDEFESYVRSDLDGVLRDTLLYLDIDPEADRSAVFDREVTNLIAEYASNVAPVTLRKLQYYLTRDFVGYGTIDPIMRDRNIEDISCVGPELPLFVYHRNYRDLETNLEFDQEGLTTFITRLAQRCGKHISIAEPLLDASMPDGSRVQLTLGSDVSSRGSNFTVRKFSEVPYTPVDLVRWGTVSVEMMAYLWLAIQNDMSVLFAGGTASGKSTSMNATSFFIPPNSKVVSIEDTREITLPHDNWIQSVTREGTGSGDRSGIDMYELLKAGLRQRPEFLLVGEVRTDPDVALTFFQAISSGHTGYTTFHADSVETVIDRLTNPPLSVPEQMVRALDAVVVQRQSFIDNRRVRRATELVEINRGGDGGIETNPVYRWSAADDDFQQVGTPRMFERIQQLRGWSEEHLEAEFDIRVQLLEYLIDTDTTGYNAVTGVLRAFARDPETVTEQLEDGTLDPDEYV